MAAACSWACPRCCCKAWRLQAGRALLPHQPGSVVDAAAVTSPIAGNLHAWKVADGDTVQEGDVIAVMEAMKMEMQVTAHRAGRVALAAAAGTATSAGCGDCPNRPETRRLTAAPGPAGAPRQRAMPSMMQHGAHHPGAAQHPAGEHVIDVVHAAPRGSSRW